MKRQDLLNALRAYPWSTNHDLSSILQQPLGSVSGATSHNFKRGYITRKKVRTTLSQAPIYAYALLEGVSNETPRKEREAKRDKITADSISADQDTGFDRLVADFAAALAGQITQRVIQQVQAQLSAQLTRLPAAPRQPEVLPAKTRVRKVCIIGLLPQQAGLIQSEFCDTFDLTFFEANDAPARMKHNATSSDRVIQMGSFTSHATTELLKSAGINVEVIHGGMSALRSDLTQYYLDQETT